MQHYDKCAFLPTVFSDEQVGEHALRSRQRLKSPIRLDLILSCDVAKCLIVSFALSCVFGFFDLSCIVVL